LLCTYFVMLQVHGFIVGSCWMPQPGERLHCIAPTAAIIINFGAYTKLLTHSYFLIVTMVFSADKMQSFYLTPRLGPRTLEILRELSFLPTCRPLTAQCCLPADTNSHFGCQLTQQIEVPGDDKSNRSKEQTYCVGATGNVPHVAAGIVACSHTIVVEVEASCILY
jgi:hypothetical protein